MRDPSRSRPVVTVLVLFSVWAHAATAATAPPLVRIDAGSYFMGSEPGEPGSFDDETRRSVRIAHSFALGRTEVTQSLWTQIMGSNPSYYAGCAECPVENVSWFDAVTFCNRLSQRDGHVPAYAVVDSQVTWQRQADGYRLPTEAEWEYACGAGTSTPYHTGVCLSAEQANIDGYTPPAGCAPSLNRGEPIEVGSFPPNAWGLCDMHGNVHEWCWDWYASYAVTGAETVDPSGPAVGHQRVCRGGSWSNTAERCRSAKRQSQLPTHRYDRIGLRLARTLAD